MAEKALQGGDKLTETLAELSKQIAKASKVRVGFLEGSTEADGTSVPFIAAIQEFGASSTKNHTTIELTPPRPYFRTMIAAHSDEWGDVLGKVLVHNGYDAENALEQMGMYIGGELQQSIIDVSEPALSDVTLMLRKMRSEDQSLIVTGKTVGEAARRVADGESLGDVSRKPLVDTGTMLKSVSYQVDNGAKTEVDPNKNLP